MLCRSWSLSACCASKASLLCHPKFPLLTLSHVSVLVICMEKGIFPELTEGSSHQTSWFNLVAVFPPPSLGDKTALFTSETFYMQAQDGLSQRPGWSATAHLPKFIRHNDLLKEWITCPCIQRLSLTSSHVLWTPRKVWHNRDVPQGWHPHATSSSDCSPTAVLQTFPALPAPD